MRSVQGRVLAGMVSGTALLLVVFGLGIYAVIRTALIDEFDASLISAVRLLEASAEQEDERIELGLDLEDLPEFKGKGGAHSMSYGVRTAGRLPSHPPWEPMTCPTSKARSTNPWSVRST